MKKTIVAASVIIFLLAGMSSFAQENRTPKWVSDKGYWVTEKNKDQPKECIVRFYNNDNLLVSTTTIHDRRINPGKRKAKMELKAMLETAVQQWVERNSDTSRDKLVKQP